MSRIFSRLTVRLACGAVAICAILTGSSRHADGGIIYSEDFEGLTNGRLVGQDGWQRASDPYFAEGIRLAQGGPLGTRTVDGLAGGTYGQNVADRAIGLPSSGVVTLTFDGFAGFNSANSGLGLRELDGENRVAWWYHYSRQEWYLRVVVGTDFRDLNTFGGRNTAVAMGIVLDYDRNQVYGRYDYGSGFAETARLSVDGAALRTINSIRINQDYRGSRGVQIDNILVQSAQSAVPEPSGLAMFGILGSMLAGVLIRQRRVRKMASHSRMDGPQ